jgi:hypothetical protein
MIEHNAVKLVKTFGDFRRLMGHAVAGRSPMHQLWLGRPGCGKTWMAHKLVENSVGADLCPHLGGRVRAPIYGGRITPAKFYVRMWLHHLDPLIVFNDLFIPAMNDAWEALLCQSLEAPGTRTVRNDLKIAGRLDPADVEEFSRYLEDRGLLAQFLAEQRGDEPAGPDPARFRDSLPEIAAYEAAYDDGDEDEMAEATMVGAKRPELVLPRAFQTSTTVVIIANKLGGSGWERVYSRLRVFRWDPSADEMIADMRTWQGARAVPEAVLQFVEACHARGEVARLDYRAVFRAAEDLRMGEEWEDELRSSFFTPGDEQVQVDAAVILDWLENQKASPGQVFTESQVAEAVGRFRYTKDRPRLGAALDALVTQGFVRRFLPPAILRPGKKGRRPGKSFEVL